MGIVLNPSIVSQMLLMPLMIQQYKNAGNPHQNLQRVVYGHKSDANKMVGRAHMVGSWVQHFQFFV